MSLLKFFASIALLFVFLYCATVEGGSLHPQWCTFISRLCKEFEANPKSFSVIYVHRESSTGNPFLHLLPPILIWAPVEQYSGVFPSGFLCPKCDCESVLFEFDWMNGIGRPERSQPRKIHGRDGVTILVGRLYKCTKSGHEVASYHPGILRQIKVPSLIPFRLWSRTGFMYDLINDIEAMMISGVSISMIEGNLAKSPIAQYADRKNRYFHLQRLSGKCLADTFPTYEQWCSFLPATSPSRHAITGCFLASFWEKNSLFNTHMQCTTIDDGDAWLSCDHTFASVGKFYLCSYASNDCQNTFLFVL